MIKQVAERIVRGVRNECERLGKKIQVDSAHGLLLAGLLVNEI